MNELFNNIDEVSKIALLKQFESVNRRYEKNKIIMSSVKNEDIICIILKGHIQVIKNDFNGNQIIIEDLKKDDFFGSITSNITSSDIEIITKEDSEIIIIELRNILNCKINSEAYNLFTKNLLEIIYQKNIEFQNHLEILANKTIRDKLLSYFKKMSLNENRIFNLPISYSALAEYLATNRSAMSRELKSLKEEGLIEIKGRNIKILYHIY